MYKCNWYFNNLLMSSYKGTQKEIEEKIIKAGEEDIFFGREYKKTQPNRIESRDDEGSIIVIERII